MNRFETKLNLLILGPKMPHLPHLGHTKDFPLKSKFVDYTHF